MKKIILIILFSTLFISTADSTVLLNEQFNDPYFVNRGWYDGAEININPLFISTIEHAPGSASSFQCHFVPGVTGCDGAGDPIRHIITATNSVYISFWIKHSSNWTGQGTHVFHVLSTEDGAYDGTAWNYMNAYINDGTETSYVLDLELQDARNIDTNYINIDRTAITESRAAQGCNGLKDNTQNFNSCYQLAGKWVNMRNWKTSNRFTTTPGPYYMQDWHFIEAYFELNTISNGIGIADGTLRMWIDGVLQFEKVNSVLFRTGAHPTMQFNQIVLAPYMGNPPADQYLWIDDLTVADSPPSSIPAMLNPPSNLRIQ